MNEENEVPVRRIGINRAAVEEADRKALADRFDQTAAMFAETASARDLALLTELMNSGEDLLTTLNKLLTTEAAAT